MNEKWIFYGKVIALMVLGAILIVSAADYYSASVYLEQTTALAHRSPPLFKPLFDGIAPWIAVNKYVEMGFLLIGGSLFVWGVYDLVPKRRRKRRGPLAWKDRRPPTFSS